MRQITQLNKPIMILQLEGKHGQKQKPMKSEFNLRQDMTADGHYLCTAWSDYLNSLINLYL